MATDSSALLSILHLIDGRIPCGASLVTKELVRALQANDVAVQMLSLYPGPVAESARGQGLNVRVVQGDSARGRWRDLVDILREVQARGQKPVIHSHQLRANRFASLAAHRTGVPHVISVHTHKEDFIRSQFPNPLKRAVIRFIHYRTLDGAAARVAVSPGVLRELNERGYVGNQTQLVRNVTLLPDSREVDAEAGKALFAGLDIPEKAFTILAAGRFVPSKRFDLLIRSVKPLANELGDVVILLAGDGPLKADLEQLAKTEGVSQHVRFLGWQAKLVPYMADCDCVVSCSQTECSPVFLIEAMSLMRPVVAAAAEDVAALIEDRTTGLLFPLDDADAMRRAVVTVAQNRDQARQWGRAAHEAVHKLFDTQATIRHLLEIYQSL